MTTSPLTGPTAYGPTANGPTANGPTGPGRATSGGIGRGIGRFARAVAVLASLTALAAVSACGLPSLSDSDESSGGEPGGGPAAGDWQEQAAGIEGLVDFHQTDPDLLTAEHVDGVVTYQVLPPVGGPHNQAWQNCSGDIYDAPIANEHAVHSLEHGAVWITHHPSLPAEHLDALAARVRGTDKVFMSPFPGLDTPISLQAWGYQLKVERADDSRIDEFIRLLRVNSAPEPNATCTGGVSTTGTEPVA